MNEQLLKMNGLSVKILDELSFESHLGIPLKRNLHYFDKEALISELIAMTEKKKSACPWQKSINFIKVL